MSESKDATTRVGKRDDGTFIRTTLVVGDKEKSDQGSIDIVHDHAGFISRINIFTNDDGTWLAVDVVDVDDQFMNRKALTFIGGQRAVLTAGKTVAADFKDRRESNAA